METTAFYILLFFHLSGLILGFGAVLVTDLFGALWLFDRVRFPHLIRVSGINEKFIWTGWGLMVAAGIPLAMLKGVIDELMIIKLFFVAVIGLNGIALHFLHKHIERCEEGDRVPNLLMFRLTLAILLSQIAWWGAMLIGFLHRHVQTIIEWPEQPWLVCGVFLGSVLLVWGAGEAALKESGRKVEA